MIYIRLENGDIHAYEIKRHRIIRGVLYRGFKRLGKIKELISEVKYV